MIFVADNHCECGCRTVAQNRLTYRYAIPFAHVTPKTVDLPKQPLSLIILKCDSNKLALNFCHTHSQSVCNVKHTKYAVLQSTVA